MKISRRTLTPLQAFRCFAKGLLLIILLFWAAWAAVDEVAQVRLERALDDLRAEGFDTCLEDLAPPAVPPEDNAALFYSAAFAAFDFINRASPVDAEDIASAEPEEKAEILKAIERSTEVFALLRRARAVPQCRFERDYSMGVEVRIPEFSSAIHLSHLLALRAQVQAERGLQDEARDTVRDLLLLAERFREEPSFELQLLRRILIGRAVQTTGNCSRSAVTEADLLAWLELLPSPSILDESLEHGLRADLASAACLLTRRSKLKVLKGDPGWDCGVIGWIFDPLLTLEGLDTLDRMRKAIDLASMPYAQVGPAALALRDAHCHGDWNFNLFRFLERPIPRLMEGHAGSKSSLGLTRAGLEAELFFVRWGRYPSELQIRDDLSGKPFVIDFGEGLIRSSTLSPTDFDGLERDGLVWRLLPR